MTRKITTLRDYITEDRTLHPEAENRTFMNKIYEVYQPRAVVLSPNAKIIYLSIKRPSGDVTSISLIHHLDDIALPDPIPKF